MARRILSGAELIREAFTLANEAHKGVDYGANKVPYFTHPVQVARIAIGYNYPKEIVAGCYLHDTIEDTWVTEEFLRGYGFPKFVVDSVVAVTYITGQEDLTKADKARSHPGGHVIKFCDATVNVNNVDNRPELIPGDAAVDKYHKYMALLSDLNIDLPTPQDIRLALKADDLAA